MDRSLSSNRKNKIIKVAETSFLQRVTSLSLRVEPLLLHIERSLMRFFGNLTRKLLGVSWVRCSVPHRYVTAGSFLLDGWTGCITTFTPTKTPYKTNFCPITDTVVLLCWWQTYRIPGYAICDTLINPHTHMLRYSTKRHTCRHIQGCKMQWHRCFVWCALCTTKYTKIHIQDRNQLPGRKSEIRFSSWLPTAWVSVISCVICLKHTHNKPRGWSSVCVCLFFFCFALSMFDVLYVGCVHVQSPPMHLRPFIVSLKVFFKCVKCVLPHCVYEYVHARA